MGLKRTYPIDTAFEMHSGAAITTTGDGSKGIVDVGASNFHAALVVYVTACEVDTNDQYMLEVQGSNTADFSAAGDIVNHCRLDLGDNASVGATPGDSTTDQGVGTYYVPFCNDFKGTTYRYLKLRVTTAGSGETITFTAYFAPAVGLGS